MCLSGVQRRGHGSYNDEYLSEGHTALQQHGKHGVEGKDPHTGPKAFNAMGHNEEGEINAQQSLQAQRQGNKAVAGSNDTPREGPVKPGTKAPRRNIRGGVRVTSGREQSPQIRKRQKEAPTANVALHMVKSNGGVS